VSGQTRLRVAVRSVFAVLLASIIVPVIVVNVVLALTLPSTAIDVAINYAAFTVWSWAAWAISVLPFILIAGDDALPKTRLRAAGIGVLLGSLAYVVLAAFITFSSSTAPVIGPGWWFGWLWITSVNTLAMVLGPRRSSDR
jgi:hypothetical protein